MSAIDERDRLFLDRVQRESNPDPARTRRIFTNVQGAIAMGTKPTVPENEVPDPTNLACGSSYSVAKTLGLKMLGAGLVAGGTLGFLGGYVVFGADTDGKRGDLGEAPGPDRIRDTAIQVDEQKAAQTSPHDESDISTTRREPNPEPETSRAIATPAPAPPRSREGTQKGLPKLTFHEEISYLRRAQRALRDGNPNLAWGLMTSLDERQPHGALVPERTVTKVIALCALNRVDEARREAHVLLESKPNSVYAERIAQSCAAQTQSTDSSPTSQRISPPEHTKE